MAADKFTEIFYLTTTGWKTGNSYYFNDLQGNNIERPENAVETWQRYEYQSSIYSNAEVTWSCEWRNNDYSKEEIDELHRRFPKKFKK